MKKIESVVANNRKRAFEVGVEDRGVLEFPYAVCEAIPTPDDQIVELFIDKELGKTGFMYFLRSGAEGVVLSDHVLWQNRDPDFVRDFILFRLSNLAQDRFEESGIGIRALARKLDTSPAQLYRILDQTNYQKSMDQVVRLIIALGGEVDFVVKDAKRLESLDQLTK